MRAQAEKAETIFRNLHRGEAPLVLANAWDAGSARLIESIGAPAIATTSAGVAWSLGYPDGDRLPITLLVASVAGIARVIRVPLTVDIEGGYADDPAAVEETVGQVVDAGAVGINIEDGAGAPDLLCRKIESARRAGERRGIALFVNARTDVYLRGLAPAERRVEESVARAERYRAAGADGIFVPRLIKAAEIERVAAAVGLPLNVMAVPGLPSLAEMKGLGVRRLSAGAGIAAAMLGRTVSLAAAFLRDGRAEALADGAKSHGELNALFDPA
jgi:2-methylisocitrate lyase-like PEP mutase family enzyme